MTPKECENELIEITKLLDKVLLSAGFQFIIDGTGTSSPGSFSAGRYSIEEFNIGLVYRAKGFGCVIYEINNESISHDDMMKHLGFGEQYQLFYNENAMVSYSKHGGNATDSLIHDLLNYFIPLFTKDKEFVINCFNTAFRERMKKMLGTEYERWLTNHSS